MTTKTKDIPIEIRRHIVDLTPDLVPIVKRIESGPGSNMTQFNYGGYMSALNALVPDASDSRTLFIVCMALIDAGGNERGIKSAAAIITGRDPLQAIGL